MTTAATGAMSRLGALVLIWLLTRPDGDTRKELDKALAPLLEQRWSAAEQRHAVEEVLATLERGALIKRVRKASFALTDDGRRAGLAALGVKGLPAKIKWNVVRRRYLFARALGLAPPATAAAEKRIGKVKGARAAILARHHRLGIGDYPTLKQVKDALAWRALGIETGESFTSNAVMKLLLNRSLGAAKAPEPAKAIELLAAKAVAARRVDANELHMALLRRWLEGSEVVPEAKATAEGAPRPKAARVIEPLDDRAFAARVLTAARASQTGRFGDNKVFISHIFRKLVEEGVIAADSEAFKARLVSANFRGLISLSRADLVQAMAPEDVDASETEHDGETFHFVRIEE